MGIKIIHGHQNHIWTPKSYMGFEKKGFFYKLMYMGVKDVSPKSTTTTTTTTTITP